MVVGRTFWLPKSGHTVDEYEDAFAGPVRSAGGWCAAVADGATEAAFSRRWARILAEGLIRDASPSVQSFEEALPGWRRLWRAKTEPELEYLPWYASMMARQGAHAAVLSVAWSMRGSWQALSLGDCCLFQWREERCVESWPYTSGGAFHTHPALVSSQTRSIEPRAETHGGRFAPGDRFWLSTDALAAAVLNYGPTLVDLDSPESFAASVTAARSEGRLRNDDVTLVEVVIEDA